jgi:hypothetical protein
LSSGQERRPTGDREKREREERERERNRISLDIDIWGIPMQLRKGVHVLAGGSALVFDRENFFRC